METSKRTREKLLLHFRSCPKMQIADVFKFLYQSAFGCEHLVSSQKHATEILENEYRNTPRKNDLRAVPLDGHYSRVPLAYMDHGLSASTLARLFVSSARQEKDGLSMLRKKLNVAKNLVLDGLLPFSITDFEAAEKEWREKCYPPVHHSDVFHNTYRPSYRVIANRFVPFLPLLAEIDKRLASGSLLVAVEGGSASGKTTLGEMLSSLYPCTVLHMDDFFLQPFQRTPERLSQIGGNIDRERFLSEVLLPLKNGSLTRYRKFDCSTMSLGPWEPLSPEKLVIVEGAYSMHPALEGFFDLSVFLDILPALQRKRILNRNSPEMAKRFFEEWIPLEQTYFTATRIKERCTVTLRITDK